jgi:hypothetical protein
MNHTPTGVYIVIFLIFKKLLEYNHIQQIKVAANRTIKMGDENCRGN